MERAVNYIVKDEADTLSIKSLAYIRDTMDSARNEGKSNGGEVFTPAWCVVDMGNLIDDKLRDLKATVLEPACGTGNILIDVVRRKLAAALRAGGENFVENMLWAIKSVYGVDIVSANAVASRKRIKTLVQNFYGWVYDPADGKAEMPAEVEKAVDDILSKNIIWGDTMSNQDFDRKTSLKVFDWQNNKWDSIGTSDTPQQMDMFDMGADADDEVEDF